MAITLRTVTGSALSYLQVDTNFSSFYYSSSISGSSITFFKTGSVAIGEPPSSSSITLPLPSKWTDISGGIQRSSLVKVIGPFAQGNSNVSAAGVNSHAEGESTTASNTGSHAEGFSSVASGQYSHAEGRQTQATEMGTHAEGFLTEASGQYSHAEGRDTLAFMTGSHAEGLSTQARGLYSHAEGAYTQAWGNQSHAEGNTTYARGIASHAEGKDTVATGSYSHAEGDTTQARGDYSHAEGVDTQAIGNYSHAEGQETIAVGLYSHAEGYGSTSIGLWSHAEGNSTSASGERSHAEGNLTITLGNYSHAEGETAIAIGRASHAEGTGAQSIGEYSHAEGNATVASGSHSHAEGESTQAFGIGSHAEGFNTFASGAYQHVQGQYNLVSPMQGAFIVGNGTSAGSRSNLVYASGSTVQITGSLGVSGSARVSNGLTVTGSSILDGVVNVGTTASSTGQLVVYGNNSTLLLTRGNGDSSIQLSTGDTTPGSSGSLYYLGSQFFEIDSLTRLKLSTNDKERITIQNDGGIIFNSGSQATAPTVLQVTGSTSLSGSLTIGNGFDFTVYGNKQYNYGAFQNNTTLTGSANVSRSFQLDTLDEAVGVSVVSGSRVTFTNGGTYNMQFSAQLDTPTAATVYIWFKRNGTNIPESGTRLRTSNNDSVVPSWNFVKTFSAGDYVELVWESNQANTTFPTIAAAGNVPICPSIIFTVQQVR
jgi:hypothetical protein